MSCVIKLFKKSQRGSTFFGTWERGWEFFCVWKREVSYFFRDHFSICRPLEINNNRSHYPYRYFASLWQSYDFSIYLHIYSSCVCYSSVSSAALIFYFDTEWTIALLFFCLSQCVFTCAHEMNHLSIVGLIMRISRCHACTCFYKKIKDN